MVVISGTENVRHILRADEDDVQHTLPRSAVELLGAGALTTCRKEDHKYLHKVVSGALNPGHITEYGPVIQTMVRDALSDCCTQDLTMGVQAFRRLSFTIFTRIFLGVQLDEAQTTSMLGLCRDMENAFFSFPVDLPGFAFHKVKGGGSRAQVFNTDVTKTVYKEICRYSQQTQQIYRC